MKEEITEGWAYQVGTEVEFEVRIQFQSEDGGKGGKGGAGGGGDSR